MGAGNCPYLFMGTCKVVKGTYGYTSVIYDTPLYNYINSFNNGTLYQGGTLTTVGQEIYDLLRDYRNVARFSFGCNLDRGGDQINYSTALSAFKVFFPNTDVFHLLITSARYELFDGTTSGSYIAQEPGTTVGNIKNYLSINGTSKFNVFGSCESYPYGNVWGGNNVNQLVFTLPIYNDDGTSSVSLYFVVTRDGIVSGQRFYTVTPFVTDFPTWIGALPSWSDTDDPFKPGGHSTHGGGGRSFDDSSDPVSLPVPSGDPVLNSGFLTMYQVNTNKLNDLASFMWNTSLFDVETWQKIIANPFDAIISLNCIPANPSVLSDRAIKIGNVVTNVSAPVVADQFVRINCGTLDVEEYSGSYLDYSPYTKVEIYLPYIGFRELNTDEIMDKTLTLVYNIDVVSGACVANIMVDNTVLYQFAGDCAMHIPVTGRDPAKTLSSIIGVVTSAGSLAGGAILGTLNPQSAVKAVTATAESVIGGKRNIQRSGNISGSAGFMGGQTPYLIITRPRQALPEEQNLYMGYPSFITSTLGDLSGMTIVADCHLENIPCTDGELQEIERLLKEGVIL